MITISVQLSEELAKNADGPSRTACPDHPADCNAGGVKSPLTPRQRVERLWEASGLSMSLPSPAVPPRPSGNRRRLSPLRAGGKPASEIIIEQRGTK